MTEIFESKSNIDYFKLIIVILIIIILYLIYTQYKSNINKFLSSKLLPNNNNIEEITPVTLDLDLSETTGRLIDDVIYNN